MKFKVAGIVFSCLVLEGCAGASQDHKFSEQASEWPKDPAFSTEVAKLSAEQKTALVGYLRRMHIVEQLGEPPHAKLSLKDAVLAQQKWQLAAEAKKQTAPAKSQGETMVPPDKPGAANPSSPRPQ